MIHQNGNLHTDWNMQYKIIEKIQKCGGMESYAKKIHLNGAFYPDDRIARCMDERTCGGVHSAGPFFLLSKEEVSRYTSAANISGTTSHKGCGAARLAYLMEMGLQQNAEINQEIIDNYADEKAKALAKLLGVKYKGQLDVVPATHHIAVAAYYAATDFDPSKTQELPTGFVINRNYTPKNAALKELDIALSIAFGAHGFGNLFTKEHPFYVIAIGNNGSQSVESLKAEVRGVVEKYGNRVMLDGFAAPHK